jgi:hypothetical protein
VLNEPDLVVCYDADTGKELWRDRVELMMLPVLAADLTARLVRAARGLHLIPPFGKRGYADAAQLVRLARAAR